MALNHRKLSDDLIAFAIAVSLVAIVLSSVAILSVRGLSGSIFAISSIKNPVISAPTGTATIQLIFVIPSDRALNLQASLQGQGFNISVPVKTYYPYAVSGSGYTNSSPFMNGTRVMTYNNNYDQYTVIFQGLKPYSSYNVSLYGVSSPYCPPGSACALGLALIEQHASVTTGDNASVTNTTFILG